MADKTLGQEVARQVGGKLVMWVDWISLLLMQVFIGVVVHTTSREDAN